MVITCDKASFKGSDSPSHTRTAACRGGENAEEYDVTLTVAASLPGAGQPFGRRLSLMHSM
ncbi:MAG: hypothetical protein RLZZ450_6053 [Pseudomonadota bacterium]